MIARTALLSTLLLLAPAAWGSEPADTPQTVEQVCQRIANKLASVSYQDCATTGLTISDGQSVNQTPILLREYPPLAQRTPLGRVLVLGGIHGDEYSSVSITFKWMRTLEQHHSGMFHWHVAPLVNPDGLLQTPSQRMNAHGVDLNRNFPTPNWETESEAYWVRKTSRDPRRFPGTAALSEPETQWLTREIEDFKPDVIVSIHAPYGILDFDGPQEAPRRLGSLLLNPLGIFPGSLGNYAGISRNIPVITVELPNAGVMPRISESERMWNDLVRWLRKNLPADAATHQARDRIKVQTEPS